MDNQRLLVWATFGMLAWLTYQAWQEDYGPQPAPAPAPAAQEGAAETAVPSQGIESLPSLPAATEDAPQDVQQMPRLDAEPSAAPDDSGIVRVTTDVLEIELNTTGATLQRATILNYPVNKDDPDTLVELLSPTGPSRGAIEIGLIGEGDGPEPNHFALFTTPAGDYELNGADEIVVPFAWTDEAGLSVEKTLRFQRGSYRIDVTQRIVNASDKDWRGAEYAQIVRRSVDPERSMFDVDTYSFDGPIIYDGEKSEKLQRDDLLSDGPFDIRARHGWAGAIQHHFLSAVVPGGDSEYHYNISVDGDTSVASLIRDPAIYVRAGAEFSFETSVFVGPKLQSQLEEIDEPEADGRLRLAHDYFPAAFLVAGQGTRLRRQLGTGHHPGDHPDQIGLLQADQGQRPVNGQNARNPAAHEGAAGPLQGRSPGPEPGDDGAV